jgi:hypothetical protein
MEVHFSFLYMLHIPAGPPFTGPPPVISLSACAIAETSAGVMRWPTAAAVLISLTEGRSSKLMVNNNNNPEEGAGNFRVVGSWTFSMHVECIIYRTRVLVAILLLAGDVSMSEENSPKTWNELTSIYRTANYFYLEEDQKKACHMSSGKLLSLLYLENL